MKAPFKINDLVTSEFNRDELFVKRRITMVKTDKYSGSGYAASADGGKPCKECGKTPGKPIYGVDAAWFKKVEE